CRPRRQAGNPPDHCLGTRLHGAALLAPPQAVVPPGRVVVVWPCPPRARPGTAGFCPGRAGGSAMEPAGRLARAEDAPHACCESRATCAPGTCQQCHPGRICNEYWTHTGCPWTEVVVGTDAVVGSYIITR